MATLAHREDSSVEPTDKSLGHVVPFSPNESLPALQGEELSPEALQVLNAAVARALPIQVLESRQQDIVRLLRLVVKQGETDRANQTELVANLANAMTGLAQHVDTTLDRKLTKHGQALGEKLGSEVARSAERGAGLAVAKAGKKTILFTAAVIAIFSTLAVVAIIAFLRWNEMSNLRAKNSSLAQENAALAKQRESIAIDNAKAEEILGSKRAELDKLESRQSELIQQIQGTAEAAKTLQGVGRDGQLATQKLQLSAAQKLIPGSKPNEFFVEVEAEAKSFEGKDGKHYIRVK